MKVLMINGSPNREGCTYTALKEVECQLNKCGVETEILQIGKNPVRGCIGCGGCAGKGRCVFTDDLVNEAIEKMQDSHGLIIGSPVYYAAANGSLSSFLDRMFYAGGKYFERKPGAAIVSARRAGTTAALDELNKYFLISQMPVVSSQYWNMVHGNKPEEVFQDLEGLQIMRTLGRNMAWLLSCIQAGKNAGVPEPEREDARARTNFIH